MSPVLLRIGLLPTLFRSGHKQGVRGGVVAEEGQGAGSRPGRHDARCAFTSVVPALAGVRMDCSRAIGSRPAERPSAVREGRRSKSQGRTASADRTSMGARLRGHDGDVAVTFNSRQPLIPRRPAQAGGEDGLPASHRLASSRTPERCARGPEVEVPWTFAGMRNVRWGLTKALGPGLTRHCLLRAAGVTERRCGRELSSVANDLQSRMTCRHANADTRAS
jgi:hypothetical protein